MIRIVSWNVNKFKCSDPELVPLEKELLRDENGEKCIYLLQETGNSFCVDVLKKWLPNPRIFSKSGPTKNLSVATAVPKTVDAYEITGSGYHEKGIFLPIAIALDGNHNEPVPVYNTYVCAKHVPKEFISNFTKNMLTNIANSSLPAI